MKKYIVKYLTENYFLDKSQLGNAGIYSFEDTREWKVPVDAKKLIEEVVTLFGYSFTRTKWLIHAWAKKQKPDHCLNFYWTSHEVNFAMPIVRSVMASTVGQDLVAVQPLNGPTGHLFYLDYQYGEIDHPTPNYILAADPVDENPNIAIAKPRNPDRQATIRKWIESGLLDNVGDDTKQSLAALYEAKTKTLLE
jgi:hypothetical protein